MGFLDRFKTEKEKELKDKGLVKVASEDSVKKEKTDKKTTEKKTVKKVEDKKVEIKKVRILPSNLENIIIRPLITEKASILASDGTYVFVVANKANKIQVRNAFKALYNITPTRVNIQNIQGKKVRFGSRRGRRNSWKKAMVTLPKGKKIDVYEGA